MKYLVYAISFALAVSLAAADCNGLSASLCSQLERTSNSIGNAIEDANTALADAITETAQRRTALYMASFNILKTSLPPSSAKTTEDVTNLNKRLELALRQAESDQQAAVQIALQAFEEASKDVSLVLEEAVLAARTHDSAAAEAVAFAVGGSKIQAIKQKLEDALKKAHGKVKEVIAKAIEKLNAGLAKLEGFLAKVLGEAGIKKVQELLTIQVERLIKLLADALAKKLEGQSEATFDLAVVESGNLIESLEQESHVAKRSAFWDKVKAAVSRLGDVVRDAALRALEKHRPIIMQKLKELGQAIINAGKDVLIEVVNGAIRAVVQS